MSNEHQTGVTRSQLYSLLSTTFVFILLVHLSAWHSADDWIALGNRVLLMVILLGMQMMFLFLALRERNRQPKKEDKAAEPGDAPGRGGE